MITGLEVLLGFLLVAIVACILRLRLGCEKPGPGEKR